MANSAEVYPELDLFPEDTVSYEVVGPRITDAEGLPTWERERQDVIVRFSDIETIEDTELREALKLKHANTRNNRDNIIIIYNTEHKRTYSYSIPIMPVGDYRDENGITLREHFKEASDLIAEEQKQQKTQSWLGRLLRRII